MKELDKYGELLIDVDLTKYNSYGIDSSCDYLVYVNSIDNLINLINYLDEIKTSYYILGSGTNVILPSQNFNGVIIKLDKLDKVAINDSYVIAECGITLNKLVNSLININKGGFEILGTIPGSLGGAIYGNAGMKNLSIMDYVQYIEVIRDGNLIKIAKEYIKYDYRYTSFKDNDNNDIIVRCKLLIEDKDKNEMHENIKNVRLKRIETQPIEYKNAGSVFKNPLNDSAGRLIDKCGLKGYNVKDAFVSEKHANFIINKGNATSIDIINLINYIKEVVFKMEHVELELEQIIVKWE